MRRPRSLFSVLLLTLVVTGCYHQVVRTGATPGDTVIERPWTATYAFGLVPAAAIETAGECPTGVAIVETQQTLLNGVVGAFTLGIYTPQTVTITCATATSGAASEHGIHMPAGASPVERGQAIQEAIDRARRTGGSVAVITARE